MTIVPVKDIANTYVATTYRQKCVDGNTSNTRYELQSFPLPILVMNYLPNLVKILEPVEISVEGTNTMYNISIEEGLVILKLKPNMVESGFIMNYSFPNTVTTDPFKNIFYTIENNDGTRTKKSVYDWFTSTNIGWLNCIKDYLVAD